VGFNIGLSMLGGIVCGAALYGINLLRLEKSVDNKLFVRIARNQDMGEKYWIDFIKNLEKDSRPVWFVGNRHGTWIDVGLSYRRALAEKLVARVKRSMQSASDTGWEVFIILTEQSAVEIWKEFIKEEINNVTKYAAKRPDLIKVGVAEEGIVRYSIVAYASGVVITPYTSRGRAAESPTFEVQPGSDVADLYFKDLRRIKESVPENSWWAAHSGEEN